MVTLNLPWELESEILSRVPPTSLKQLRLTCKRWYALFKDPIFTKNHLGKAATQMVLKDNESVYSFSFSFQGFHDQFIKLTGKLKSLKDSEDVTIDKIFHCDGLFLCTTRGHRLVVWNPCTGQTRRIQLSRPSSSHYNEYYLGYENNKKSGDNYKILSCSCIRGSGIIDKYEIYEFNSDSWRVLDVISDDWLDLWYDIAISFKGNIYWVDSYNYDPMDNVILRFDFITKKFERLPLPFKSDDDNCPIVLSSVREEKLALLNQYPDSLKMKIWVTNTKTDEAKDLSWSEFLVVDLGRVKEFVVHGMPNVESFLVDEENKKVMCCNTDYPDECRTRIYIVGEDTHKNVYREVPKVYQLRASPRLFSYFPSLVLIPGKAE